MYGGRHVLPRDRASPVLVIHGLEGSSNGWVLLVVGRDSFRVSFSYIISDIRVLCLIQCSQVVIQHGLVIGKVQSGGALAIWGPLLRQQKGGCSDRL